MGDQGKNILIGVFALVAISIMIFIILFLHPTTGDEGQVLHVHFSDIDKVNVGTRVTFAGRPVGEVSEIHEVKEARQGLGSESGRVYAYRLTLRVDSGLKIYSTDIISLRTSGLLGERSVAIIPVLPPEGQPTHQIGPNDILFAEETGSVEDTMTQFKQVANKIDTALDTVTSILEDIGKEAIVKKLADMLENLNEITAALNQPDEITNTLTNLEELTSQLATRLPGSWDTLDKSLVALNTTSQNARAVSVVAKDLVDSVQKGEGSIGRVLVRNDLYLQLKALLAKADTTMNDINHFGILFQLDKGWQRLRARRLNLMQQLSTPQEFRNYFNDELDQVNTALSRVMMVLEKSGSDTFECCLLEDPEFLKVLGELLQRVQLVNESIQLYNQELGQCTVQQTELAPQ